MRYKFLFILFLLSVFSITVSSQGQDVIVLQIAMHEAMTTSLDMRTVFSEFEDLHDGVQVQPVAHSWIVDDIDSWKNYLQQGDVVFVEEGRLTPEITRTGFLLDLAPLYSIDTLEANNAAGDSFVWDGGRWAMPSGYAPIVLSYDSDLFDELALPYPETDWTLSDLQDWTRVLSESGVETPIYVDDYSLPFFLRQVLEQELFNPASLPLQANFQADDLEAKIAILRELMTGNLLVTGTIYANDNEFSPVTMAHYWTASRIEGHSQIALGMDVSGFAISAGTNYPELAYELTRFLVQHPSIVNQSGGWSIYGDPGILQSELPLDMSDAITLQQTLFTNYLMPAIQLDNSTVEEAIQQAEINAQDDLLAAGAQQSETVIVREAEPRIEEGTVIHFAVQTNLSPLPNRNTWSFLAREFAENHPDVTDVVIDPVFDVSVPVEQLSGLYDCYYTQINLVPDANLSAILPLNPLMDADPTLDPDDFVGTMLDSVTRDNQIWGFPLDIKPYVLWISDAFIADSGLDVSPAMTTETFMQLIGSADETPVMIPYHWGGRHIMLLVYAFDGLPYDYNQYPPAIDFTSQETIDAVNSVISLIETDTLDYYPLTEFQSGSGISPIIIAPMNNANIRGGNLVFMSSGMQLPDTQYNPYLFPRGRNYTPISYDMGTMYISADSDLRTECYDFLSFVSREPSLSGAMPARLSTIEAMRESALRREGSIDFYQSFAELAGRPDTIVIPTTSHPAIADDIRQRIFSRAIDLTISGDLILEDALFQAEELAEEFQVCLNSDDNTEDWSVVAECYDIVTGFMGW